MRFKVPLTARAFSTSGSVDAGETRDRYIAALRAADNNDIAPLLAFVRT